MRRRRGPPGTGSRGTLWYNGIGVPGAIGSDNDYYLDSSNGDVYIKLAGVWNLTGNIRGAAGANGTIGRDGTSVPGMDGKKGADGFSIVGQTGAQGLQGIQGNPGNIGPTGPSASPIPGIDGKRGADGFSIKGDKGDAGAQGNTGAAGIPNHGFAIDGKKGDLGFPGPKGDTGSQGAQGNQGNTGPAGASGYHAIDGKPGVMGLPGPSLSNTPSVVLAASITADLLCNAVDTYLLGLLVGSRIKVGTFIVLEGRMSKSAAGVTAPIWTVRMGAAGAIGDTARVTINGVAQTGVIDQGWFTMTIAVRALGAATGVLQATLQFTHTLATTGLQITAEQDLTGISATFDNTGINNFIGLSVNPGALGVWTFQNCTIKAFNLA